MAELITLNTPITYTATTDYEVRYLELDRDLPRITIKLRDNRGEYLRHAYTSTTATALMNVFNTKSFASTSMHKEIIKRLQNDGVIGSGVISGTPDT